MILYHHKFETDQEARDAFTASDSTIVAAGGVSWTATADGAGPAFHVVVLPEGTKPEALGIEGAYPVTSFTEDTDKPEKDDLTPEQEQAFYDKAELDDLLLNEETDDAE